MDYIGEYINVDILTFWLLVLEYILHDVFVTSEKSQRGFHTKCEGWIAFCDRLRRRYKTIGDSSWQKSIVLRYGDVRFSLTVVPAPPNSLAGTMMFNGERNVTGLVKYKVAKRILK